MVATNLTPAKVREYQNLKVVLPTWIVQSVAEGKLLPWQKFMYRHASQSGGPSLLSHSFSSSFASTSKSGPTAEDAVYTTDPVTKEQAARVPGYSAHASNIHAQRAMERTGWRETHTVRFQKLLKGSADESVRPPHLILLTHTTSASVCASPCHVLTFSGTLVFIIFPSGKRSSKNSCGKPRNKSMNKDHPYSII